MNTHRYTQELKIIKQQGNYRTTNKIVPADALNLSSNDYLGILDSPEFYEEFIETLSAQHLPFTAASSRLLTGNSSQYVDLEHLLLKLYGAEAALVYNSGYHANCGILPALTTNKDLIIADKLVHASIIDGLRLSPAKFERFRHADYQHLERLLTENANQYEHIFIVTESIFSMDGDKANLHELVRLKKKFGAYLYIDEAHAVGVYGEKGLGLCEQENCMHECDFIVGTFGKAFASVGAYVVCSQIFADYLVNHSRTLIFTTALPPVNLAWTKFIVEKISKFSSWRTDLQNLSAEFSSLIGVQADSHIIPYIIGENSDTIRMSQALQNQGFYVLPIRYPTVAKHTARLRFSLQSHFTLEQLQPIQSILTTPL